MLSKQHRYLVRASLLLASLAVVGCGQREVATVKTYPTRGRLLWKGEPVRFARIELDPVEGNGAVASAQSDEQGVFEVRTFGNAEPDGAVPGEYLITVKPKAGIPPKYDDKTANPKATEVPSASQKTTTSVVVEAKENDLEIILPEG